MSSEFHDRLIHVALRKGYLDAGKVRQVFQRLRVAKQKGRQARLHQVLLENRLVTREQLVDVRRTMAKEGIHVRLGDFEILSRIGRGAMGTVYCARQRSLGRVVALKVLASHLAVNEDFVQRFLREARMAVRLDHPNIVQVFDLGQRHGMHYIVMEYVAGSSLESVIESGERLSEERAVAIATQVAKALAHAEACGVVHRDIKPGNILLDEEGQVKLADMGLAIAVGEDSVETVGTPYYMSPEQARNDPDLDIRSDIYSLGCALYHALTGLLPYKGETAMETLRMHVESPTPEVSLLRLDISAGFSAMLRKMMAKEREERFEDSAALVAALGELRASAHASQRSRGGSILGRPVVWAIVLGAIALVVLVVLLVMWLSWRRPHARSHRPPELHSNFAVALPAAADAALSASGKFLERRPARGAP